MRCLTAQLALMAGIPVQRKADGTEFVKVSQSTANYLFGPHVSYQAPLICVCRSFRLPHEPERHNKLRADYDWRTWQERGDVGVDLEPRRKEVETSRHHFFGEEWFA